MGRVTRWLGITLHPWLIVPAGFFTVALAFMLLAVPESFKMVKGPIAAGKLIVPRDPDVVIDPTTGRPKLTAQDAKIALVEMLRREAVRDPKRCLEVWGSTEPDQQLATVRIRTNCDGGMFTVQLDEQNYSLWRGLSLFEGSFGWEQGGWRALDYQFIARGCIIGQDARK